MNSDQNLQYYTVAALAVSIGLLVLPWSSLCQLALIAAIAIRRDLAAQLYNLIVPIPFQVPLLPRLTVLDIPRLIQMISTHALAQAWLLLAVLGWCFPSTTTAVVFTLILGWVITYFPASRNFLQELWANFHRVVDDSQIVFSAVAVALVASLFTILFAPDVSLMLIAVASGVVLSKVPDAEIPVMSHRVHTEICRCAHAPYLVYCSALSIWRKVCRNSWHSEPSLECFSGAVGFSLVLVWHAGLVTTWGIFTLLITAAAVTMALSIQPYEFQTDMMLLQALRLLLLLRALNEPLISFASIIVMADVGVQVHRALARPDQRHRRLPIQPSPVAARAAPTSPAVTIRAVPATGSGREGSSSAASVRQVPSRVRSTTPRIAGTVSPGMECPITMTLMRSPTIAPCGHTFEKSCIEASLRLKQECPLCRHPIRAHQLKPNYALIDVLQAYRSENVIELDSD